MISLYFGLPGCGKTTLMSKIAHDTDIKIEKDKKRVSKGKKPKCPYSMIYGNVPLANIKNYRLIEFDWLGRYEIANALILIDEASLEVDCRDYKGLKKHTKEFMLLHRHFRVDICYFNQCWDGLDKKIRVITDRVYYLYKGVFTGKYFSRMYRVPYGIIIPDPKKDSSEKLGEIVQGYCRPNFFVRLFSPWVYRPLYYQYFDSWDRPKLTPLPPQENKAKV